MTHPTTDRLYDAVGPGITGLDPQGILRLWIDGPASLLGEVDDIVRDTDDGLGWSREFDTAFATHPRWTAQFLGVTVPDDVSDSTARELIATRPSFRRGTVDALKATAAMLLTGTRHVGVRERDGSAYRLTVTTYTTETPDVAAVNAALQAAKPAGLVLTHQVVAPTSYSALEAMAAQTYMAQEAVAAQTYTAYETGA